MLLNIVCLAERERRGILTYLLYAELIFRKLRSLWAWNRLALHQLDSGELSEAENSFQQALRINPKDGYIWQGLAETYRRVGKLLGKSYDETQVITNFWL